MSCTGNNEKLNKKSIGIWKYDKHSDDLKLIATAIAALAGEIWREHYTPIIGAEQVDYMLEKYQSAERIFEDIIRGEFVYYTATGNHNLGTNGGNGANNINGLIGYCACQPQKCYLLLSKLYVQKDNRGRGVARGFLEEAIALCRNEFGFDKIRLTVNKYNDGSIAVYRKMGFTKIDSVKTDIGGGYFMDDYVMELCV